MSPQTALILLLFVFFLGLILLWILIRQYQAATSFVSSTGQPTDPSINTPNYSFINISLPLYFQDDLWWTELTVAGKKFPVIIDTGSSWLTLPNITCAKCQGPSYLNETINSTSNLSYGGGQTITYETKPLYIEEFGQTVNVSIISDGSNPNGTVKSVLGLLNPTLGLQSVILDFPGHQLLFNPDLSALVGGTAIDTNRFISVRIPPYQGVNSVVLDSGTNFILSPISFPDGFNFQAGRQQIYVPNALIRSYEINPLPTTVILGNKAMSNYRWEIDLRRKLIWANG
jgi:hypothetical protein